MSAIKQVSISLSNLNHKSITNTIIWTCSVFGLCALLTAPSLAQEPDPDDPIVVHTGSTDDSNGSGGIVKPTGDSLSTVIYLGSFDGGLPALLTTGDGEPDPIVVHTGSTDDSNGSGGGSIQVYTLGLDATIAGAARDSFGDLYLIGSFAGTLRLNGATLETAGGSDAMLLKYDRSGALLWAKRFGGSGDDEGLAVAVTTYDEAILAGRFSGEADFDARQLESHGRRDVFLAANQSNGSMLWVRQIGGDGDDAFHRLQLDADGFLTLDGAFHQSRSFGAPGALTESTSQPFAIRYDWLGRMSRVVMEEADWGE